MGEVASTVAKVEIKWFLKDGWCFIVEHLE